MYFLLNLSHCVKCVKRYGDFCQILALFTISTYQIWSCHVAQDGISKNFYFVLILHLISGKVGKFLVETLSTSEVISQKPHRVENTPSAFRVKDLNAISFEKKSDLCIIADTSS